jgi:hypothetical protein
VSADEVFGTHEIPEHEQELQDRMPDIMIPIRHPWADLIDGVEDHLAGIITSAPTSIDVRFDPEAFARAVDTIAKAREYERTRYVVAHSRWHRIMEAASPGLRADLESLVKNGTVILSGHLPDENTAYRIQLPDPEARGSGYMLGRFPL